MQNQESLDLESLAVANINPKTSNMKLPFSSQMKPKTPNKKDGTLNFLLRGGGGGRVFYYISGLPVVEPRGPEHPFVFVERYLVGRA